MVWIDVIETADYLVLDFLSPKKGKTKQNNKKSNFYETLALLAADEKIINYCH